MVIFSECWFFTFLYYSAQNYQGVFALMLFKHQQARRVFLLSGIIPTRTICLRAQLQLCDNPFTCGGECFGIFPTLWKLQFADPLRLVILHSQQELKQEIVI